jgi:hypothetical protein
MWLIQAITKQCNGSENWSMFRYVLFRMVDPYWKVNELYFFREGNVDELSIYLIHSGILDIYFIQKIINE